MGGHVIFALHQSDLALTLFMQLVKRCVSLVLCSFIVTSLRCVWLARAHLRCCFERPSLLVALGLRLRHTPRYGCARMPPCYFRDAICVICADPPFCSSCIDRVEIVEEHVAPEPVDPSIVLLSQVCSWFASVVLWSLLVSFLSTVSIRRCLSACFLRAVCVCLPTVAFRGVAPIPSSFAICFAVPQSVRWRVCSQSDIKDDFPLVRRLSTENK